MSWVFQPLLPAGAQQQAGAESSDATMLSEAVATAQAIGEALSEAAASSSGIATAIAIAESLVDAAMLATGAATAQAIGDGGLTEEEQEIINTIIAAGGAMNLYPDLLKLKKKKKKEQEVRQAEAAIRAQAQAEADFRILLEAVRIRDDAGRLSAVKRKRAAMMADLENAALIRQARAA